LYQSLNQSEILVLDKNPYLLNFINILIREVKSQKKICYVTYQSFPADTANSLQTISNIKYFVKNDIETELIFPLREKNSNSSADKIKEHYSIDVDFKVQGIKHFLPFGKVKIFEGFFFHVSHFLWSLYVVKFVIKNQSERTFITRSDWILYFLARKGLIVLFECHQTSRVRTFVINKVRKCKNVKFIFLNEHLQSFYKMDNSNSSVLHNGVDPDLFLNIKKPIAENRKGLIFIGSLKRFNEDRGIDFIVETFKNSKFLQNQKLSIIGGPTEEADKLRDKIKKLGLHNTIKVTGKVNRSLIGELSQSAEIGILINSSLNKHSFRYTSPLKYFEYLYAGLKIVAVDFPSHRVLPRNNEINFFDENDNLSFENAVKNALGAPFSDDLLREEITLDTRVKKILNMIK
jgi:glycosyltransferase involved in cell wall biosynthesis